MPDFGINITHSDFSSFDGAQYRDRLIAKIQNKSIPEIKFLFQQTVDGWEHKPNFSSKLNTAGALSLSVYPDGPYADQYALVSKGSAPHNIFPSRGRFLRFQGGYRSATKPGVLSSQALQRSGQYQSALGVRHPGFEPRNFPQTIIDLYSPIFMADMQDCMRK